MLVVFVTRPSEQIHKDSQHPYLLSTHWISSKEYSPTKTKNH